ncbi:alpha/beta hydrolase [Paraglaciecola hydrolytica]|uniref:Phospholipase n=1 Tax=Paraglaciecola hydrolytica TaxID=1799789 RepID=A0A148KLF8_9ALTE|nr:alpha/beta hydrolase [Paraglaciecola hydrolytica]KXI27101.1 phospholipase [Paraglaciecola hydrolytica]
MKSLFTTLLLGLTLAFYVSGSVLNAQSLDTAFDRFAQIYQQELGSTQGCQEPKLQEFAVCSSALRGDGNAPYILHHGKPTDKVIVLFHGLSDSPFFLRSIAGAFHLEGYNVVVALLPGHGLLNADADMQDSELANRWRKRVADISELAINLGDSKYIGGFSTGGALATEYVLKQPGEYKGLLLFSGALRLDSTVETLANVWGMRWVAKLMDGDYQTAGRNPVKYPKVSTYAALQLVDVISSVREKIKQKSVLNLPIFVAHSQADATTLIQGVKDLMAANQGQNKFFEIPLSENVCHADLVISDTQLQDMHYDMSNLGEVEACSVPQANPLHTAMIAAAITYLNEN